MSHYTIYHNPRCSKSRQTLALLEQNDIQPDIVLYMDNPLSPDQIKTLLKKLDIAPRDLLRKGEKAYKERNLKDTTLSDQALLDAMHQEPRLIERPIVVSGENAKLGRPPESVLELL